MVDAPELMLVGLQARAETNMGAIKVKLAVWEAPFRVAVMVAVWFVVIVPRVAVKVVEVLATGMVTGTVTDAGTLSAALLLDSATTVPPAGGG